MHGPRHVLIAQEELESLRAGGDAQHVGYRTVDDGDLAVVDSTANAVAELRFRNPAGGLPRDVGSSDLLFEVWPPEPAEARTITAWSRVDSGLAQVGVTVRPSEPDVFDRVRGVFESDRLRESRVLVVGVGSGGSFIVRELAKAGVGSFTLVDHDRLDESNVCRHELGLSDIGRRKVNAMRDYVLDRNPQADVDVHTFKLDGEALGSFIEICTAFAPDLIVCGTDNRESRLLINRVALMLDTVALYGGVRRRAYAGQVLRVIPHLTPCYQCFITGVPDVAIDVEVSSDAEARPLSYTDRVVVPEPGLSTDIAPVAMFMAKLALVELTREHDSAVFESLRTDLVAPWYFWLNRRELDTPFEHWPPLPASAGGPGVLRWMAQYLDRDEACPACGLRPAEVDDDAAAFFAG